jgi:hypothetical protein
MASAIRDSALLREGRFSLIWLKILSLDEHTYFDNGPPVRKLHSG